MPVYSKGSSRILFVHIPKTGGSSIGKYLRSHGWEESRRSGGGNKGNHATWEEYEKWGNFDYRFAIVRDPVERFKSDILHLSEDPNQQLKIYKYFGHAGDWTISDHEIEKFFDKMRKNPQWLGNHIRPQSDFLNPNGTVRIFKYPESINEVPFVLNAAFNVPLTTVSVDHLKRATKNKPSFTKTQEQIIKEYYKKDYKRFFRTD